MITFRRYKTYEVTKEFIMGKVIGIDLGTTNSCVAIVENKVPKVIINEGGSRTTPSIVAYTKDGDRLVGQTAPKTSYHKPREYSFLSEAFHGYEA